MKRCPYCGKEYSDDVVRCLIDDEVLLGVEPQSLSNAEKIAALSLPPLFPGLEPAPSAVILPDRQLRIIELLLVCLIAFGGFILSSGHSFFLWSSGNSSLGTPGSGIYGWLANSLREVSGLGLLWYVLTRRGRSFSDLGLVWARKDVGWSIILKIGGSMAFSAVYYGLYYAGITQVTHQAASARVSHILFGGGISFVTILFQFLNPFFEELIVRAYLMTEVKQITNSATKAVILSTALQTSYHLYQGVPVALAHGATFLIFSIYYAKTNRITPVILAHLYTDVGGTMWYLFRQ